jgi:Flp pilus assembly pilin Flp
MTSIRNQWFTPFSGGAVSRRPFGCGCTAAPEHLLLFDICTLKQEQNMKRLLARMWRENDGVLSFEWTLLVTLLTIGIVGGLAGARDAIIDELGDVAEAAQGIDQSYTISGLTITFTFPGSPTFPPITFTSTVPPSSFQETAADAAFTDCTRTNFTGGQGVVSDSPS